ncbi:helix-turn-helix transcriptional regulator [Pseudonocardia sp. Cha107L01]|jgi:predicted ArsR family transcriptional regulator|uniref:helix-turn-helix transcriptional regulator n=1 Tax=Pseudonocardia sp. Cha107L01 TaxID=3457576 RepID=UPI00403E8ACC
MKALRASDCGLDVRELAELCGLHITTARFHLDILREVGLVVAHSERGGGRGRPRLVYLLAERRRGQDLAGYELLATMLAAHWDESPGERARRAERAGREAALSRATPRDSAESPSLEQAASQVSARFAQLGFEPEVKREGRQVLIRLHRCPFRSVAEKSPEVVCSLHLGLMRGALEQMGAPVGRTSLEPFVRPHLCIARLEPTVHAGSNRAGATSPGTPRPTVNRRSRGLK